MFQLLSQFHSHSLLLLSQFRPSRPQFQYLLLHQHHLNQSQHSQFKPNLFQCQCQT